MILCVWVKKDARILVISYYSTQFFLFNKKVKENVSCSVVSDSLWTPWTVAHQTPLSMGFSRQEYWSGLPFPSPGDLPNPGMEPGSPPLQADSLPSELPGKPKKRMSSPWLAHTTWKGAIPTYAFQMVQWLMIEAQVYSLVAVHTYHAGSLLLPLKHHRVLAPGPSLCWAHTHLLVRTHVWVPFSKPCALIGQALQLLTVPLWGWCSSCTLHTWSVTPLFHQCLFTPEWFHFC